MAKIVIVNSETMGSEYKEMGQQVLGSFFRKIACQTAQPDAMIFYNSGVKLMVAGSPLLADLEILERSRIDLIACATCVRFFELGDKIVVGRISNMQEIAQMLIKAESVITL